MDNATEHPNVIDHAALIHASIVIVVDVNSTPIASAAIVAEINSLFAEPITEVLSHGNATPRTGTITITLSTIGIDGTKLIPMQLITIFF